MNYLVTGGAGFIGSNLVEELLNKGNSVVVLDDFSTGKKQNLEPHKNNKNLKVIRQSITQDLDFIFKKYNFDAIFHLAALPRVQFSIQNPDKTHFVNVNGTFNLLNYARRFETPRFVFSSSSSVYGDQPKLPLKEGFKENPMSPYALHKLFGERYCALFHKLYGVETISLRYFNVYGPRQDPKGTYATLIPKFIDLIQKNIRPTINGDGHQTRDFTYVSDVVAVNILSALTQNKKCIGEVFNIGASNSISVNDVTKYIKALFNSNIEPIHGPALIEPKHTKADIKKAKKLLDWSPKVTFSQGLKMTYNFVLNNNK